MPEDGSLSGPRDAPPRAIVFLSGDLMFASRVQGAAEASGFEFHFGGSLPETESQIEFVVVDLATRSGVLDGGLVGACREKCPGAKLIAFGPHVQVAKLEKARAAGIQTVLTRGQFDRSLGTLFSMDS